MHGHMNLIRERMVNPEAYLNGLFSRTDNVIVDYGCGTGFYCKYLRKFTSKLYCVDINSKALEELKKSIQNVITLTDVSSILDNSVDVVFFANSFHDMEKEEAVRNVKRVLKENGIVIIIDWKKERTMFGPPPSIRMSEDDYLIAFSGFKLDRKFDSEPHHYGLVLKR
jgi:ubiquinone/menaquinone biosynthesis C-methylase UbiE